MSLNGKECPARFYTNIEVTVRQKYGSLKIQKQFIYQIKLVADVAQLVEQLICNQPVGGSSPLIGSIQAECFVACLFS